MLLHPIAEIAVGNIYFILVNTTRFSADYMALAALISRGMVI
jgi:hypothetical protein